MKYLRNIFVSCFVFALLISNCTIVYAEEISYVGQDAEDCKESLKQSYKDYEIVYKYTTNTSKNNNEILSQTINKEKMIVEIVVNNTSNVGVVLDKNQSNNMNSFQLSEGVIIIDGNFEDWSKVPISYEYEWDNSKSCWEWGLWDDGVCYKTPEGTFNNNVRHIMQMVCDGEYVYVHIKFAKIYGSEFARNDYCFYIDGELAAFDLEFMNKKLGYDIRNLTPGAYEMKVRHRNSYLSYLEAEGALGFYRVYDNHIMSDLEIRIPLEAMKDQNPDIGLKNIGIIEFFNPDLMYRRISCAGTSTSPYVYAAIMLGVVGAGTLVVFIKRKKMEK